MIGRVLLLLLLLALAPASNADVLAPGSVAPTFTLPRIDGAGKLALADYRGKVVYLDFWASWCKPCRDAMPALNKLYEQYQDQGLVVIGVNLDTETEWAKAFLKKMGVSYPIVTDPRGATPTTFGLRRMPTAFLLGRDGRVRYVHEGFLPKDLPQIRQQIVATLGSN